MNTEFGCRLSALRCVTWTGLSAIGDRNVWCSYSVGAGLKPAPTHGHNIGLCLCGHRPQLRAIPKSFRRGGSGKRRRVRPAERKSEDGIGGRAADSAPVLRSSTPVEARGILPPYKTTFLLARTLHCKLLNAALNYLSIRQKIRPENSPVDSNKAR